MSTTDLHCAYLAYPEPAQYDRLSAQDSIMAFSFGFSGDDIEEDPNDVVPQTQETSTPGKDDPPPIAARTHDLDELVGMHFEV